LYDTPAFADGYGGQAEHSGTDVTHSLSGGAIVLGVHVVAADCRDDGVCHPQPEKT